MPVTIEPLTPADLPYLPGLQPEGWHDIVPSFRYYLSHTRCFPIKAVAGGVLAAVGAGILFQKSGWLAHIITHPSRRRQGIGAAVVDRLKLLLLNEKGCRSLSLIATDLGRPVYLRAGFMDLTEYAFFNRDTPVDWMVEGEAEIRSGLPEDERAIMALDKHSSGEARDWVLREHLPGSLVYIAGRNIAGYFLPTLGEGLILAKTVSAGRALLRRKMGSSVRIVLPAVNTDGGEFLAAHGYRETMRCRRMLYGAPFDWHHEHVYSRIAGNMG